MRSLARGLAALLILAALLAYAAMLKRHLVTAVGGSDSSGYMNEARLFASGHMSLAVEPVRTMKLDAKEYTRFFMPVGFREVPHGRMVPTYPAGLPLHFLLAGLIGGWSFAPYCVSALSAIASLFVLYAIARELGLERWWSIAAAAILAATPIVISTAIQPLSDDLATFWALVAMLCALRAQRTPSFAVAAGIALGIGVWVRPTNLLMALPLLFAMRARLPLLLRAAAGALPFGLAILVFNHAQYGSATKTGYGTLGEMIEWSAFGRCSSHHVRQLLKALTILPLAGVAGFFDRGVERWTRWTLAAWIGIFFAFYSLYDVCTDWWDMRFILPAVPALILGFLLLVQHVASSPWRRVVAAGLIAAVIFISARRGKEYQVLGYAPGEQQWPRTVHWAESQLPPNALVMSGIFSGAFLYYSHRFIIRWDLLSVDDFQLMRAYAANANLRWYAVTSEIADCQPDEFRRRFPGRWTVLGKINDVTLWRLEE